MFRQLAFIGLGTAASLGVAQEPAAFPAAAEALSGDALRAKVAGKSFRGAGGSMKPVRLQYNDSGYVYLNASTGFRDTGKWRIEGSSLCTDWRQSPTSGCSETRVAGDVIYAKRANGEVMTLTPE